MLVGVPGENFVGVNTKVVQLDDVHLCGACFGSQPDFLVQGASGKNIYFALLYLLPSCLIELFAMPTVVALLQCTGVFGCGCLISSNVRRNIIPSWHAKKSAPSSALAAEATTNLSILHRVKTSHSVGLGDH